MNNKEIAKNEISVVMGHWLEGKLAVDEALQQIDNILTKYGLSQRAEEMKGWAKKARNEAIEGRKTINMAQLEDSFSARVKYLKKVNS